MLCLTATQSATAARVSSISTSNLKEFGSQPAHVKNALQSAVSLTRRNLSYRFGSNNASNGGLDCSGTTQTVLRNQGIQSPRTAAAQYLWVKNAGNLRSTRGMTSESDRRLAGLKPGDLLFWEGTYNTGRYPRTSHVMIYLGRDKSTGKRVMMGASSGRRYQGQSRSGVSVFDFSLPRSGSRAKFVGYGTPPGLERSRVRSVKKPSSGSGNGLRALFSQKPKPTQTRVTARTTETQRKPLRTLFSAASKLGSGTKSTNRLSVRAEKVVETSKRPSNPLKRIFGGSSERKSGLRIIARGR